MRPLVVVDLMAHTGHAYAPEVVAAHHRFTDAECPLVVVGPDAEAETLASAAGIQVTGSTTMLADAPWAPTLSADLEAAARAGVPVLGVCFGHQMLGVHFGSTLESWAAPRVGLAEVTFTANADGPFVPNEQVMLLHTHRDHLTSLGPDLEGVATGGLGGIQAWRHRSLPMWGIQAHPEADAALTRAAEGDDVAPWSDDQLETPQAKRILQRFATLMAGRVPEPAP